MFDKIYSNYSDKCSDLSSKEFNCEDVTCILEQAEVIKNNIVDEEAAKELFENLAQEYPQEKVLEKMDDLCLNGKYMEYFFEEQFDDCPAMNLFTCVFVNVLIECSSWKDSPQCASIAEQGKQCKMYLGTVSKKIQ
ncbi:unnamed protein product [Leptidea sinapis]|uniref:Uncharacterized protein n=1 Tax=Leptidea sinapis TaxID=189913 RepID=A0A5E4QNB2_9NEOP|nr:unnamed protein product [Leptidea sinapis]